MNILYRACASKKNYQLNILEMLRKKEIFEKCTVISQTLDHGDRYPEKYYHEIQAGHGYHASYNAVCDYDALPAVPRDIWQKMLPYKSTVMDMTCRIYNMHLMTYDEMEMIYIKHVRFWNWVLTADNVGFCFFTAVPHTGWEYTIYALAKVSNIPTLLINEIWIEEMCAVATDLSNFGSSAAVCFQKHEHIGLDQNSYIFYKKIMQKHLVTTRKDKKKVIINMNQWQKKLFYKPVLNTVLKRAKMKERLKKGNDPYITVRTIWNCNNDIKYACRHKVLRAEMKGQKYYNRKLTNVVNLNEKYILFSLQLTPEATTLPQAGVFSNQLLTVQLLAEAAKEKGIKVYVKEHWIQNGRTAEFYNELSMIPNVYFIRSDIDNDLLMKHAYMVSSQTGTCIVEAFTKCIPCLIFSYNSSAEAPGVYYVGSKNEILHAIDQVKVKRRPTVKAARKYFEAICKTSVRSSLDWNENRKYTVQECTEDIVGLITDYINKGMPQQYYYENNNLDIRY